MDHQMDLLSIIGYFSSFLTIESEIRNAIQAGSKSRAVQKLKNICGTHDFSSLPEELAAIADEAESYLFRKKSDIIGESLFSPKEKAEFIETFFKTHSDALPYRGDIEEILSAYLSQLESHLLQQMSAGEKMICRTVRRTEENTNLILEKLNKLTPHDPEPTPVLPHPVTKKHYKIPDDYIPRKVVPHAAAMHDTLKRFSWRDPPITLTEAFEKHNYLLLLSDAGHGKSTEVQNLAGVLCKTPQYPFLYSLNQYCGGPIRTLLPASYRALPPENLVLLFDGYDEMQAKERDEFMRRLQSFIEDFASVKIVISSRSNFCNVEIENRSQTFRGFQVYDLDRLTDSDILSYLSRQAVDAARFLEAARLSDTLSLLQNPFYLTKLVRLYQKDGRLPGKAEIMDYLITESFHLDDKKFQENLEEQRRDLYVLLENVAFAMQLMQKSILDDAKEYQELFPQEKRALLKYSGLLQKEGRCWRFVHNNFKEYLAAKYLSALPQDEAVHYFSDGHGIKISWVNTFGFFANIEQEWDVKAWILEHTPSALVKFEPDHLESNVRADIFKFIFLEREKAMLWPGDDLYTVEQLAVFACCEESLEFLLDKIRYPAHEISQLSAIWLLWYFPRLFGRQEETTQTLLACCTVPAAGNELLCSSALEALTQQKLVTPEIAGELTAMYYDCPDSNIRMAMYRLLARSGLHNAHVQFFLNGIAYTHGDGRAVTETISLLDGLKALSKPDSIQTALRYLVQIGPASLCNGDAVYEALCGKAAEQFLEGQTEYYQIFINSYIASAEHGSQETMRTIVHFFEETGTIEDAVTDLINLAKRCFDLDPLFSHPENLAYAGKAYGCGRLEDLGRFQEIVQEYADDTQYREYRDLILKIDHVTLPDRKQHIDVEERERQCRQEYFDLLFDKAKAEQLLLLSIQRVPLSDPTVEDLIYPPIFATLLWEFICGLQRNVPESTKAADVFQILDWNRFMICEASFSIQNTEFLQISDEQKSTLRQLIRTLYVQELFKNTAPSKEKSEQIPDFIAASEQLPDFIAAATYLTVYLELIPEEAVLLQMTELSIFCFPGKDGMQKYAFLSSHVPADKLLCRIAENVKTHKVHGIVLQDHIRYCTECGCEDIREAAVEVVKTNEGAKIDAITYLYKIFGAGCVQKELLPFAGHDTLLEIQHLCPDLSKAALRTAMERQFQAVPSLELMARLLTLGSGMALREYIRLAKRDKTLPDKNKEWFNRPTEAIGKLRDPELLPLLEKLMGVVLSPDFQNREFYPLLSNLRNALIECGIAAPERAMWILQSHQGTPEENECAFRFCSHTMEGLKQKIRMKQDVPWKIRDVKRALATAK